MDDGRNFVGCRMRIREEKAFGNLRKGITEGFGFVSKRNGEVGFELGDQVWDDRALKSCEVREGKELADILYIVSSLLEKSCVEEFTLLLP